MIYRVRLKKEWNNEKALARAGITHWENYVDRLFYVAFDKDLSSMYGTNCYMDTLQRMLFWEHYLVFLESKDDEELDEKTDKALEKAGEKILADMGAWDKVFGIAETKDPQRLNDIFDEEMVKIEIGRLCG